MNQRGRSIDDEPARIGRGGFPRRRVVQREDLRAQIGASDLSDQRALTHLPSAEHDDHARVAQRLEDSRRQ
jgi:hypothetical protein